MENFFKLNRYNLRHRKKKKEKENEIKSKEKSNLQPNASNVSISNTIRLHRDKNRDYVFPADENHGRRTIHPPPITSFLLYVHVNKDRKQNQRKECTILGPISLSLSHFRTARGPWQLLTFIRTPCRSFHVVSFGHRAARCIPMQITLAPGTRRNRRNFMLLRNATCPPSPSFPLSFLAQTMSEEGSPQRSVLSLRVAMSMDAVVVHDDDIFHLSRA